MTSLDLKTTYSLDDSAEVYEMPENQQLVVAHFLVKHSGNDINSWGATNLAILYGRSAYSPFFAPHSTHPEFPDPIGSEPQELDSVGHQEQYQAEALTVGPDEKEDLWLVTVLPRDAGRSDLQVGYEDDTRDTRIYPIRWEPSIRSKATPSSSSTGE